MANVGVFDVLGPIMIGPSSSHTAGAARLGKIAKNIVDKEIRKVTFLLHGSFAQTYKGHGTDRALVAGILGMNPDDARLRHSLDLAKEQGIQIEFIPTDLGDYHPNTVKFMIIDIDGQAWEVLGSSIGGGLVEIGEINGNKVQITGEYQTIIINNEDVPGTLARISKILYDAEINIASMKANRQEKGAGVTMTFELDHPASEETITEIKAIEGIKRVITINPVGGTEHETC
ncbi:MAG: L-serine ammonia-lyase, iron-sulfur-dependent subunit beta [Cellulosilyticum sp.]|nr:L-serine ammonia-lyase, iron-sulfur-dependent subunit beta [Cellulosilyticum sp.]